MSNLQIDAVLGQIRSLRTQLDQGTQPVKPVADGADSFGALLGQMVKQVNEAQTTAGDLATRFEAGDEKVSLAQVMVANQTSSVSFQAAVQVRNKLLAAYQDVMNMQI